MSHASHSSHRGPEESIIDTIQSLIVAFVLAMTFRGFVVEGFVIPTGSMAPTLFGENWWIRSDQTGYEFGVGIERLPTGEMRRPDLNRLVDPSIGQQFGITGPERDFRPPRMGDRILVVKSLYPFFEPDRYDVVVFKNPTAPMGASANYIKRLVGLPNEIVWFVDGDVFVQDVDGDGFHARRKPPAIQNAVWQPLSNSDWVPIDPMGMTGEAGVSQRWMGLPWVAVPKDDWTIDGRTFHCDTAGEALLQWNEAIGPLNDWNAYNMLSQRKIPDFPLSDVRVTGTITAGGAGLEAGIDLRALSHVFEYRITGGEATVRMWRQDQPEQVTSMSAPITALEPGTATNVEFWNLDQSMQIVVGGEHVVTLEYDWTPVERIRYATGEMTGTTPVRELLPGLQTPSDRGNRRVPSELAWHFTGAPFTLQRITVDRDLYYRPANYVTRGRQDPAPGATAMIAVFDEATGRATLRDGTVAELLGERSPGYGSHPDKLVVLGPDQFLMLGDNSAISLDGRVWGPPHPLIVEQTGDPMPFVVNRSLLVGKAWLVYYPAPHALTEGGRGIVPDFGRLRFIR